MKNKVFLDSNILIYLYSFDEPKKKSRVQALLAEYDDIYISTQVLFEFCYVMDRKFKHNVTDIAESLEELHEAFSVITVTYEILRRATIMQDKTNYSFPDRVILAAALEAQCAVLFSEDMHNDHTVAKSIMIINPFVTA